MFKKRKLNPSGVLVLDYIRINSPKGTTYKQKGLYGYLLETANGDVQALEKRMTEEFSNYYKDGPVFSYDNHFDKYLVKWDIKCIVEECLGGNSWDDVSEETRKSLYKDYPMRALPDWSSIVGERY